MEDDSGAYVLAATAAATVTMTIMTISFSHIHYVADPSGCAV
jgi:hypothetical protein